MLSGICGNRESELPVAYRHSLLVRMHRLSNTPPPLQQAAGAGLPKASAAVAAVSLALSRSLGVTAAGSIVVNTAGGTLTAPSFATINKRVGQAIVSTGQTPATAVSE